MSVTLSDKQYGELKTVLTTIARTRYRNERGNEQPLNREKVNLMARDACDVMGWPYYGANVLVPQS